MRGVQKLLLVIVLAALLATGFTACGDDDSTSASTVSTTQETTSAPPPKDSGSAPKSSASRDGSAAFRTPGGDNSIQSFGDEASAEELEATTAVLAGFMQARAEGDWAGECDYLAKAAVKPLEQLASSSPQFKGGGCAAILATFAAAAPASSRANTMVAGVASLRVEGDRGFALYHGANGVDYFVPMSREDGEWKVAALAPSAFP